MVYVKKEEKERR